MSTHLVRYGDATQSSVCNVALALYRWPLQEVPERLLLSQLDARVSAAVAPSGPEYEHLYLTLFVRSDRAAGP